MNAPGAVAPQAAVDTARAMEASAPSLQGSTLSALGLAVEARGVAVSVLATLACVFTLSWAQSLIIPLLLGIVIAYTLNPVVSWLEAIRIPRVVATAIVMLTVVAAVVLGVYSLRGQVQSIIEQLPQAAAKFATGVTRFGGNPTGNLQKVQSAASQVEKATVQATGGSVVPRQAATHVVVDQPAFKIGSLLWTGSMGALAAAGQAAMVIFLVFFLLIGGDTFKRKLVRLTGPSLSKRKITVNILDDINSSIQKYMLMLLATNLLVALLSWGVFWWMGLDNAGAWALAAGLLHVVPYLGPGLAAIAVAIAVFMQLDSPGMALLAAAASLTIATLVGTFVTTWMTGRIASMNSAAVFISLLFWGWLWGIWGMLLSIPLVVIAKVISQHVEQLHPVAELLGE